MYVMQCILRPASVCWTCYTETHVFLLLQVPVYALVKFSSSACALKVLQTPNVVMDGKKLVIKPRAIPPVHTSFAERKRLRLLAVSKAKKTSKNPQASSSALTVAGPPQLESEVVSKKILQIKSVRYNSLLCDHSE